MNEKHDEEATQRWREMLDEGAVLRLTGGVVVSTQEQLDAYLAGEPLPDATPKAEEPLQTDPAPDAFANLDHFIEKGMPGTEVEGKVRSVFIGDFRDAAAGDEDEPEVFCLSMLPQGAIPADARERLLKINGVGEKLADAILEALKAE